MADLSTSRIFGDLDINGSGRIQGGEIWHEGNFTDNHVNWDTAYSHSQAAHAPSDAQKNSDITKSEIEAKLTGTITTHAHTADHTHTNKATLDGIASGDITNWNAAYTHALTTHAPSDAQKNSDITKSEIEAKLIGTISTHDHNGQYYTESEVDTKIANLIESAPETLNTLNELAAALGDDPNFATTISTQIGNKLDANANAVSASKLLTARSIGLGGDLSGSASFDGTGNITITATVADDSHNHIISNIDGLQTALDGKSATSHNHSGIYEPANANIQAHVTAAHAPSNAQKNSDILKSEIEAVLTGDITSHNHGGTYYTETEADTRFAKLGSTVNANDHYINYEMPWLEGCTPQYFVLCVNAGNNDVNGSIRLDRTSGNYQAAHLDVIVSSGRSSMFGGALTSTQLMQSGETYRLVTLTYNTVSYVAIEYVGNTYPATSGVFFTGRLVSSGAKFITLSAADVSNVAAFGGNSKVNFSVTEAYVRENAIWHAGNFTDNHVNWDAAYTHSQATHARTDATLTASSTINGNIKINGTETTIYTHPANHAATVITQDSTHRFITDTERTNWGTAYTHSQAAHAPSTAQANADITKAEIEAKLIGVISSHSHTGAGGATGAGGDEIFWENGQTVTTSYTITSGTNAMSAGPITIDTAATVTIPVGSTWTVV